MIHEILNPVKTDIYPIQRRSCLTDGVQRGKIVPAVFNQAASREKLLQLGRQAVSFAHRAKAVFFTPASPLHGLFPMVNRGKARLVAAATNWQFLTPCPLFATPNREKFWAALNRLERGFTMQTQAARSGFLSWQQDTLPEIHDLIKQIKRAKGYQAARAAIVSAYEADSAAYGHIAAAIRAQIALDRHNRAKSTFPLAGVWIARITHARQAQSLAKRFHVSGSPKDGTQADTPAAAPKCVQDSGEAQAATSYTSRPRNRPNRRNQPRKRRIAERLPHPLAKRRHSHAGSRDCPNPPRHTRFRPFGRPYPRQIPPRQGGDKPLPRRTGSA